MADTLSDFEKYGLQILKSPLVEAGRNRYFVYQNDPTGYTRTQVGEALGSSAEEFANQYGVPIKDLTNISWEQNALANAGYNMGTGGSNFGSAADIYNRYNAFKNNYTSYETQKAEEKRSADFNAYLDQYKGTQGIVSIPLSLQPNGQDNYVIKDGVLINRSSLNEPNYENNPNYTKVPIGAGFGYAPKGSAAQTLQQGIAQGTVSPTNPMQQYQASLQGNNISALGIKPVSPAVPSISQGMTPPQAGQPITPNVPNVNGQPAPQLPVQAMGQTPILPLTDLENKYRALLSPSAEENAVEDEYNNLISHSNRTLENIRNRQVPMRFIAGESEAQNRMFELQKQTLQQRLATLQAKRQAALDATKFSLDRTEQANIIAREAARYNQQRADQQAERQRLQMAETAKGLGGAKTPYVVKAGTVYHVSGRGIPTPEAFFKETGVSSFDEAYKKGILSDYQETRTPIELNEGNRLIDPITGRVIASNPKTYAPTLGNGMVTDLLPTEKDRAAFNQIVGRYAANEVIKAADKVGTLQSSINEVRLDPANGVKQLAVIYGTIKALDLYDSAVREGEITLANNTQSFLERFANTFSRINNNQLIGQNAVLEMASAAEDLIASISDTARRKEQMYASQAKVNGIGEAWSSFRAGFQTNYETKGSNVDKNDPRIQKYLDQGYSLEEIQSVLGEGFNQFGSDTQQAPQSYGDDGAYAPLVGKIAAAIGQYESGGNYKALGPVVTSGRYKGDRAYGKYQIMGKNISSWTQQAIGKAMTSQQFLNDPKAQDAVAQHFMAQHYVKYGNLEDVASVWFSGRPLARAGNAKDVLGTSVPQYVKTVRAIYNKLS